MDLDYKRSGCVSLYWYIRFIIYLIIPNRQTSLGRILYPKNRLWSHIEKQVKNTEVRLETVLAFIHLIVAARNKVSIVCRMLRIDGRTEVDWIG